MKAVEGGEGRAMLIVPLPSGAVSMSVMLPAVPEVGAAPAERGCRSHFAALIWRRESEICQLPVEAQRTLGAFFRQQQRALHLCVVLRDRQLNFIATKPRRGASEGSRDIERGFCLLKGIAEGTYNPSTRKLLSSTILPYN